LSDSDSPEKSKSPEKDWRLRVSPKQKQDAIVLPLRFLSEDQKRYVGRDSYSLAFGIPDADALRALLAPRKVDTPAATLGNALKEAIEEVTMLFARQEFVVRQQEILQQLIADPVNAKVPPEYACAAIRLNANGLTYQEYLPGPAREAFTKEMKDRLAAINLKSSTDYWNLHLQYLKSVLDILTNSLLAATEKLKAQCNLGPIGSRKDLKQTLEEAKEAGHARAAKWAESKRKAASTSAPSTSAASNSAAATPAASPKKDKEKKPQPKPTNNRPAERKGNRNSGRKKSTNNKRTRK
jgi:hypothetical protein